MTLFTPTNRVTQEGEKGTVHEANIGPFNALALTLFDDETTRRFITPVHVTPVLYSIPYRIITNARHFGNPYLSYSTPLYPPPKYSPSTATFACQIPSRRTSLNIAGAGKISTIATGTSTTSSNESSIVIPGLITRK